MDKLKDWWTGWLESHRVKRYNKRVKSAKEESEARIQVREFDGKLYLCFDNQPLVWVEDFVDENAAAVVNEVRGTYAAWLLLWRK